MYVCALCECVRGTCWSLLGLHNYRKLLLAGAKGLSVLVVAGPTYWLTALIKLVVVSPIISLGRLCNLMNPFGCGVCGACVVRFF